VNNGAAGLKISAFNTDNNKLDGLVLVNTSGALLGDFSEADGNGASGIKVSGGGGNTMVVIDSSGNGAEASGSSIRLPTRLSTSQRTETVELASISDALLEAIRTAAVAAYPPAPATAYRREKDQRRRAVTESRASASM
jgi:hypothetical protein